MLIRSLPTSTKERAHFWFWMVPGLVLTVILRDWLPWTAAMSWWALVYTARTAVLAATAQETAADIGHLDGEDACSCRTCLRLPTHMNKEP